MCWCSHNKGFFHLPSTSSFLFHSIDILCLLAVEWARILPLVMMALTLCDEFKDVHTLKVDLIYDYLTDIGIKFLLQILTSL